MADPDPSAVLRVLNDAASRPADDRARFLAGACAGDAALRAKVEALLTALESTGDFLAPPDGVLPDRSAAALPRETPAITLDDAPRREGPGARVGRYKLLQQIGEGGFGVVFMAEQEHPVRRRVALKIIKPGMDSRQVVARFEAERQALAMMDHPNIAKVLDGGSTPDGRPYFVMELVKGSPITTYCDENKLDTRARLELFVQVCRAVQHAHHKAVIHRDLKPSNVLVTVQEDGKPVPKVIDFGIAKATQTRLTEKTLFTEFRQFVGTPEYMSPEQADVGALDVDTRSDVYSLGVLLYELLTGLTPFDPKELRRKAYGEIQRIIREVEPPKPSTRLGTLAAETAGTVAARRMTEARKLGRLLRGDLDWIVMRCLEKDRTRRYDTANGLALDIERYLRGETITAGAPGTFYRLRKFVRRNRILVATSAAIAASLLIGIGAATYGLVRAERRRVEAEVAKTAEGIQRRKADDQAKRAVEAETLARTSLAQALVVQGRAYLLGNQWERGALSLGEGRKLLLELGLPRWESNIGLGELYAHAPPALSTTRGDIRSVEAIALLPDGRTVLCGGFDRRVHRLDAVSGTELSTLGPHERDVFGIAASADGKLAVSGDRTGELKVWDLEAGQELHRLTGVGGAVCWGRSIALSPDRRTALSVHAGGTLASWDLQAGSLVATAKVWTSSYAKLVMSQAQGAVFTMGPAGRVSAFRVPRLEPVELQEIRTENARALALSPDGKRVALGDGLGRVWVCDTGNGKTLIASTRHDAEVRDVLFTPDGRHVVSCSADRTLRVIDLEAGGESFCLVGHTGVVTSLACSADGATVFSGSLDGSVRTWDLANPVLARSVAPWSSQQARVSLSADGRTLLRSDGNLLRLIDVATGTTLTVLAGPMDRVSALALSADGRTAICGTAKGGVVAYDVYTKRTLLYAAAAYYPPTVCAVAISPDNRSIAAAYSDGPIRVFDVATGREIASRQGYTTYGRTLSFSPDGSALLYPTAGGVGLWRFASATESRIFPWPQTYCTCATFDGTGRRILAGAYDPELHWLETESGTLLRSLRGHGTVVNDVAVSHDGRMAVSAGSDGTLRIWHMETGEQLKLAKLTRVPTDVSIDGNGSRVAYATDSGGAAVIRYDRADAIFTAEQAPAGRTSTIPGIQPAATTLAAAGSWYALRNRNDWATDLLESARRGGTVISPLALARCYLALGRRADAATEFNAALRAGEAPAEYLLACAAAASRPPDPARPPPLAVHAPWYDAEVARLPDAAQPLAERGHFRARTGRFAEAVADLGEAIARDPSQHYWWFWRGCLLAYLGDRERYRQHCAQMIDRFGNDGDYAVLERITKTALSLPGETTSVERLGAIARRTLDMHPRREKDSWARTLLALYEYRAGEGHYDKALEWLESVNHGWPPADARALFLRSMTLHKLGRTQEALASFAEAQRIVREHLPALPDDDLGAYGVENWLICEVFRREAEAMINGDGAATRPADQGRQGH